MFSSSKNNRHRYSNHGFTLGEVLMVVAIVAILAAISFPAVIYFRNLLHQTTLDNTAREIFVASQNKLSGLKSCAMDMPNGKSMGKTAPSDFSETGLTWTNTGSDTDFYVYSSSDDASFTWLDDTSFAPKDTDGKYIVEFNRSTGDVYGVFYWNPSSAGYTPKSVFSYSENYNSYTDSNGTTLSLRGGANKKNRMKLFVGYYGANGVEKKLSSGDLNYTVSIENADRLSLSIVPEKPETGMDTEYIITVASATDTSNTNTYTYQVEYKNGAAYAVNGSSPVSLATAYPNAAAQAADYSFKIVLDSLEANLHFTNLFAKIQPGDDITVTVNAIYVGSKGIYTQQGQKEATANSLFDALRLSESGTVSPQGTAVQIANGRHLQNLSYDVSSLGHLSDGTATAYTIKSAKLTSDIDWSAYNALNTKWSDTTLLNSFYPISNIYASTASPVTYGMSVGLTSFDGQNHEISNLTVTAASTLTDAITKSDNSRNLGKTNAENRAAAGLFGFVYNLSSIKDITLSNAVVTNGFSSGSYKTGTAVLCGFVSTTVNSKIPSGAITSNMNGTIENIKFIDCSVNAQSGSAAMTAGYVDLLGNEGSATAAITDGLYIKNCRAYLDDENSDKYYQQNRTSNPNYYVSSPAGNAGGLVGFLDYGVIQIEDSFSAVNVYGGINAGGLIGASQNKLHIYRSYSSCDITAMSASDGGAGGIAGKIGGGWIKLDNCFTTCDVHGEHYSGGAFGWIYISVYVYGSGSVTVSNCLSYGAVTWKNDEICSDSTNLTLSGACSGGFVGRVESSSLSRSTFSMKTNCRYLSMNGYNNSNPGSATSINGYGYDYAGSSSRIQIIPALYENDGSGSAYMPAYTLSSQTQQGKTHAYLSNLKNHPFPFELITSSDSGMLEYHGNWPQKGVIETSLCYYEKYENGTDQKYGYYAVTAMGSGQSAWTLNTLMSQDDLDQSGYYLTEDGYALISSYEISQFNYVFDGDIESTKKEGTIPVSNGDATDTNAGKIMSGQELTFTQSAAEDITSYDNIYKLPFFLQETQRDKAMAFYDRLEISYTATQKYDDDGQLKDISVIEAQYAADGKSNPASWSQTDGIWQANGDYIFYYCSHFSRTAINPYIGRVSATRPAITNEVYVRSARQLNALGRYCYYWNGVNNSSWNKYRFIQELDLNYSTYTKTYCGTTFDMTPGGAYENKPIGRTGDGITYTDENGNTLFYSNFRNDYDGQNYKIINYKLVAESLYYVGLFGEVYDGTVKNVNLCSDDTTAEAFGDNSQYGGGYVSAVFTYGKLYALSGSSSDSEMHNYGLGALVGKLTGGSGANPAVINCSVSGYSVLGVMDNEKTLNGIEINRFPLDSRKQRNFSFQTGGLIGTNNGYVLSCTAENKLVKFTYAHPYSDNTDYGREKYVGGIAGSNQGILDGCYAGGSLQIAVDPSASYGVTAAQNGFYIGGIAGSNCYAGFAYEKKFVSYSNNSGTYYGVLAANSYSFCTIEKSDTVNNYVPYANIYGITNTTDTALTLDDYTNTIKVYSYSDANHTGSYSNVPENVANCYFLEQTAKLGKDSSSNTLYPQDASAVSNGSTFAGVTYALMEDVPSFADLLNTGAAETTYIITDTSGTTVVPLNAFDTAAITAAKSYPYSDTLVGEAYPFPAVIENGNEYEHYGNWPLNVPSRIGLCYYEKYGDGSTGLYIYGVDTENYSSGDPNNANTTGAWFENSLKYDTSSIVTQCGYVWASRGKANVSGLTAASAPAVDGYGFYTIDTSGSGLYEIVETKLPNTNINAYYNPCFASSIRLGSLNGEYANQLGTYQIRTIEQFVNMGISYYNTDSFEQTINITTAKTFSGTYVIQKFAGRYDGAGRQDDGVRASLTAPESGYKITFTKTLAMTAAKTDSYVGIIGTNTGALKNMDVTGAITCTYNNTPTTLLAGGLVGSNESSGSVVLCKADIDLNLTGSSSSGLGLVCAGGLIGKNTSTALCYGNASFGDVACGSSYIKMNNGNGYLCIGGFVGNNQGSISSSYSSGNVCTTSTNIKSGKRSVAGGFAGACGSFGSSGTTGSTTSSCYSTGAIPSLYSSFYIGQFTGGCYNGSVFRSCYGWVPSTYFILFYGDSDSSSISFTNCYSYAVVTLAYSGLTRMPSWNSSVGTLQNSDIESSLALHWVYNWVTDTPAFSK